MGAPLLRPAAHDKSISHQKPLRAEALTFICINDLHAVLARAGGGGGGWGGGWFVLTHVNERAPSTPIVVSHWEPLEGETR